MSGDVRLVFSGDAFANLVDAFESAYQLPCYPDVARLDQPWLENFVIQQSNQTDRVDRQLPCPPPPTVPAPGRQTPCYGLDDQLIR